ncbi:hypothetical protein QAD02_020403 [Eretmocerus hayati]|uniref:Uncharacterized protein n=1 Tax=Eretmocerus hayati TaxID=131215 RepID=A0ACC2PLY5_9HYME|nr:hypothetical protein QAD02_020403 [Eretmocerus hayati]
MNYLFDRGIEIEADGKKRRLRFVCPLCGGDNLGANGSCEFCECFVADYFCRICRASSEECKYLACEIRALLRNKENYERDLKNNECGVIERCVFNDMHWFHIGENKYLDLMHDMDEGISKYTLKNVLNSLILTEGIIDSDMLNFRIEHFDYGNLESSNKPSPIILERSYDPVTGEKLTIKLKQSSAQMACFTRYLGLMIGELRIPKNNEPWKLYRILRKIVGILTSPSHTKTDRTILREYARDFLNLYVKLYGPLPPKLHFLIHYIILMEYLGPPVHYWTMPHERKNRDLKQKARATKCSKNLPLTMAIREQLNLCFLRECVDIDSRVTLGTMIDKNVVDQINRLKLPIPPPTSAHKFSYVKLDGTKFSVGDIFVQSVGFESSFAKIHAIYAVMGEVFFLASECRNIHFSSWYHAYQVEIDEAPTVFIDIKKISWAPRPLQVKIVADIYISTRYD